MHGRIISKNHLKKANLPEREGRKAMSLHAGNTAHGRQVARYPFCGPRLAEWRNPQYVEKSDGDHHVTVFITRIK